jgi:DNA-binding IclR family transcriptional regulator/nitroimidazol reductase NimA-like FMN-containing flavoprotein (pyridoxamine 5'-phosphate oxidase superfamily)
VSEPYAQNVPAVDRAARLLRELTLGDATLAELARSIDASPSSTLAILNTLKQHGLVERFPTGRYAAGPGLIALGGAVAEATDALGTFERVAGAVVDALGETVVLWLPRGDQFVLTASRDGTGSLRYVARLGEERPASDLARVRAEFDDATVAFTLPLTTSRSGEQALLSVIGPSARMTGAALDQLEALIGQPWSSDRPASELSGPIEQRELDGFLAQGLVASLSYLADDGYPATIPLWFDWDGKAFWLLPRPGADWVRHVRRNPRVSLAVSESSAPLRRVLARGPIEVVNDSAGGQRLGLLTRLTNRYAGVNAARLLPPPSGELMRLRPEQLIAWRGLVQLTPDRASDSHQESRSHLA